MTEQELGLTAQGTTRWIERWYGSEPKKGSAITTVNRDEIAVIGGDKETHRQVRRVVMAHNAAFEALVSERTRADEAEKRERELREAGAFLLERLVDHEVRMTSDEDGREWYGHVTPAMARLRTLIQPEPDPLVEKIAAAMAKSDGLDWDEQCGHECEQDECNSGTCIAALSEDHDPDWARGLYRSHAAAALSIMMGESL